MKKLIFNKNKKIRLYTFIISILLISIFILTIFFIFPQKAFSENITTFPIISNSGLIELYITEPLKYKYGDSIIEKMIIEKINNSKKNITILAFDIDNANIIDALLMAETRGVDIKIICDINNTPKEVLNIFNSKSWLIYYKSNRLMHHKIIIFDENEVCLGSMNFTVSCMYANNNDFYIIKNKNVADLFLKYFEYLSTGRNKLMLKEPIFIDGFTFYFANSPYYNINDYLIKIIDLAKERICFAYSTFTNEKVANQIIKNVASKKLFFFGILEKRNAYSKYSVYQVFLNNNYHIYLDRNDYYMHHKLLIVDNIVLTGSYAISDRKNSEKSIEFNDDLSFSFEDKKISDFLVNYLRNLIIQ